MTRYAALLRGINVGGRARLAMPQLREIAVGLGFEHVQTYLQSGNLVFASPRPVTDIAGTLHAALREVADLDVPVLVRSGAELAMVVAANPLPPPTDPARFFVSFCAAPVGDALATLDRSAYLPEVFAVAGREVYTWLPDGMNGARLTNALIERKTCAVATSRNWRTVLTLAEMTAG
jgi:uncharacterized protein (DUF1697 family)